MDGSVHCVQQTLHLVATASYVKDARNAFRLASDQRICLAVFVFQQKNFDKSKMHVILLFSLLRSPYHP